MKILVVDDGEVDRAAVRRALMNQTWPGNVRQLFNAVEHAFVVVEGDRIGLADLPPETRQPPQPEVRELSPEENQEKERISKALAACRGNRTRAAKQLGISRVTLWKKIDKPGIERE